jgi:bifunctional DNA-binding transcriptional regulator/antitoxin component of YhaV-PrlF toxin-antitoxin module
MTTSGKSKLHAQSKLQAKGEADHRVTVPHIVLERLGLEPGDELAFILDGAQAVRIERAVSPNDEDCFATFTEWSSEHDDLAYSDL